MIKQIFAQTAGGTQAITNPLLPAGEKTYQQVANNPLGPLIARLWRTIIILGGLTLLIFLIWGGIDWLTSEGDSEKLKNAKNKITNAFIGMVILAISYAIIKLTETIFGFNILNFEWPTP